MRSSLTTLSQKSINVPKKYYEFYINNPIKNAQFYKHKNNYISTTKYNIITFFPKSLLLQFSRLPNIYFLFIAIIQSIKIISPLKPLAAILPLCFVLSISLIRELIEDISRYKYDRKSNNRKILILKDGEFVTDVSSEINVGDIILINENEEFPCDCILLDSSHIDGVCYIETSSLDGEKNLKTKTCNKEIKKEYFSTIKNIPYKSFIGKCQCDMPNPELYKFSGKMSIIFKRLPKGYKVSISQDYDVENLKYTLNGDQMLLKGSILRQTKQIAGICLYAGSDNKILLNSKKPRIKFSRVELLMGRLLVFIFFLQIILCFVCVLMHSHYEKDKTNFLVNFIFPKNRKVKKESLLSFFTYLLLLNTMIPISLIVTLEIIKVIQGYFITKDIELYSFFRKKYCSANTVSIIEELGKINYVFSDKTGTLTCNKMELKYCVIGDKCFEYISNEEEHNNDNSRCTKKTSKKSIKLKSNEISIYNRNNQSKKHNISEREDRKNNNLYNNTFEVINNKNLNCSYHPSHPFLSNSSIKIENQTDKTRNKLITSINNKSSSFLSDESSVYLNNNDIKNIIKIKDNYMYEIITNKSNLFLKEQLDLMNEFWFALSIGNECFATYNDIDGGLEYNGVSPDDIELVCSAKEQGYILLPSLNDIKKIKFGEKELDFQILNMINFSSERKRMSIIVNTPNDQIKIYTKGADSEILKRLNKNCDTKNIQTAIKFSDYFSRKGYRTLFIAYKIIDKIEYRKFSNKLKEVELNLNKKEKFVNECIEEMEQNFFLLGVTIVEDKLQDKVPETIQDLRNSGIKIWMLTGDKIDTAENISLSCNLITLENKNFKIKLSNSPWAEISHFFNEYSRFSNIQMSLDEGYESNTYSLSHDSQLKFSIIIDSPMLSYIFSKKALTQKFLQIAVNAESVVCCRVSPLQKSQVVQELKKINNDFTTLAIGDGGNDVSMILESHVGIGIYGEEGMLAVQSSDFSIGEFKYLRRLLFFHGRNSINRTGNMILYFFFKNFVFSILQFYFMFFNIASGQSLIDDWFISFYNLIFTALPLGVQALTNFDFLEEDFKIGYKLMPILYKESNYNNIFSKVNFFFYLIKAIIFSLINYFLVANSIRESSISNNGIYADIWCLSLMLYTNIIFIVSFSLMIKQLYYVWIFPFMIFFTSWAIYFGFCSFVQYNSIFNSYSIIFPSFSCLKFWLNLILVSGTCFILEYFNHVYIIFFTHELYTECMLFRKYKNNTTKLLENSKIIRESYNIVDETFSNSHNNKQSEINIKSSLGNLSSEILKGERRKELKNLKEEEEHVFDNSKQVLKNNENNGFKALNLQINLKEKGTISTNNSPFNNRDRLTLNFPNKNYYQGITKVPEENNDSYHNPSNENGGTFSPKIINIKND